MTHTLALFEEHLPPSAIELVRVVGLTAAIDIIEACRGVRFYVPVRCDPDHWLTQLIGRKAAQALIDYANGDEIEVPRCVEAMRVAQELQIAADFESGASNATLARRYGYTERGIRKLRRRLRLKAEHDRRQTELF